MQQRHLLTFTLLIILALMESACTCNHSNCNYKVQDIGSLPSAKESLARGINSASHIVGWSKLTSGVTHAFLYREGEMTDLGTLGGANSNAYGINDADVVVGSSQLTNGKTHAFRWINGTLTDLFANLPYGIEVDNGVAHAINRHGWIAGNADLAAVIWKNSNSYERLEEPFAGPREANDINDSGQIAGSNRSLEQAFRWEAGVFTLFPHLVPYESKGLAINSYGQVVGWTLSSPPPPLRKRAVLFRSTTPLHLGTLGGAESIAHDINDNGLIVGEADDKNGKRMPFIYNLTTQNMQALPTGGESGVAYAINNHNIIIGTLTNSTGETRAVKWFCTSCCGY